MKKQGKLKKGLAILLSLAMVAGLVPAMPGGANTVKAASGSGTEPSVSAYATKTQLMDGTFAPNADGTAVNIGKLVFGKNSSGNPQEWYILGKDGGVSGGGNNTIIFAASPIATGKAFSSSTSNKTFDPSFGVYASNPSEVFSNHYGASELRVTLQRMLKDESGNAVETYFTTAEQGMMNATTVTTKDTKNSSVTYTTTDKLYALQGDYSNDKYLWAGTDDSTVLAMSSYWSSGDKFWLRSPDDNRDYRALLAYPGRYVINYYDVNSRRDYAVQPASNLNLSSVLFASAATAASSDTVSGTLTDGTAMTLRLNGTGKNIGTVTYNATTGDIKVAKGSTSQTVALVVQGKDGTNNWYYSKKIDTSETIHVSAIEAESNTPASIDLSTCKIWLEITDKDGMIYAVNADKEIEKINTTYVTKEQLMNSFKPYSDGTAVNTGKLVFGKKSDGTTAQEWYILGKDGDVLGDNTIIFAASPIATNQVFENDYSNNKDFQSSFGVYASNPSEVYPNHYGASDLRVALQGMATNTSYFTTAEQGLMNATTVKTKDTNNNSVTYTTTDKLYALQGNYHDKKLWAGTSDSTVLAMSSYWSNGDKFWLRSPYDDIAIGALLASPGRYVDGSYVDDGNAVQPASNLNLSSVLFASAATAASSDTVSGTLTDGTAMTLRLNGTGKDIGTVTYDTTTGDIKVAKGSTSQTVALIVQGNDEINNWYFSKKIDAAETVNASAINSALSLSSDIDLSGCKIWLEITDTDGMIYAVGVTEVLSITSVEITGIDTPVSNTALDTEASCVTTGVSSTTPSVKWTPSGSTAGYNTSYTASITLTADTGYEFTDSTTATVLGNSATSVAKNDDGTLTVTYAFPATAKDKLTSITPPQAITVANGTAYSAMNLPAKVNIVTEGNTVTSAPVTWNTTTPASGSYDPAVLTQQTVTLNGTVVCPDSIDANGVSLTTIITITISAAGIVGAPTAGTYATKTQLMDGTFAPNAEGTAVNYGKIVFGKKSDGTTAQEWYILGKDERVSGDNTIIFASSPIATGQVFNSDTSDKTYDSTTVNANHYGASYLRVALQNMATNTSYFTTAEQGLMNPTTVTTNNTKNSINYTTTDKLYALAADDYGSTTIKAGTNNQTVLAMSKYWSRGDWFWLRSPGGNNDNIALLANPGNCVYGYYVYNVHAVQPASNLNLSSVLFASAATAASSDTVSNTIASETAMTLRFDGTGKNIGTVTYNTTTGDIKAVNGSTSQTVALVVQGNDGTNNWYYSKKIDAAETVNALAIKSALSLSSDIDLSACKIWLEITDTDGMIYAVGATEVITSVEITDINTPVPNTTLDTEASCATTGVSSTTPQITWTPSGTTAGYNTSYTASITLTADTGYEFTDSTTATVLSNSATSVTKNADGTLTVTYDFSATAKDKLTSITAPQAITVANGTAYSAMNLPATVNIVTEGNTVSSAPVTWNTTTPASGSYEPAVLTQQTVTLNGTVDCPDGINANGVELTTTITITISAAGIVGAPTANPTAGTYSENQSVELTSSTEGATIYYTTDGSEPTITGETTKQYTEPILVTGTEGQSITTTIKAIAVKNGMQDSSVETFTYTIHQIPVAKYTYATNTQLMDGTFAPITDGTAVNIGKLVFGKNSSGEAQEWYILGKDESVSGDNTIIFAANPIEKQVFEDDCKNNKTESSLWSDCDYSGVRITEVCPNHYGASDLRVALKGMATNISYFTTAEQGLMNATTVTTYDKNNRVTYTTTDNLYALQGDYQKDKLWAGTSDSTVLARSSYWSNGSTFWLRSPSASNVRRALLAIPGDYVRDLDVDCYHAVQPASNLNLSSVLFASSAKAASSDTAEAGPIAEGTAMTLRLNGTGKNIGTVTYNTTTGDIKATKGSTEGDVALVVQGKDGTNDWYYSKKITGTEVVNVTDIVSESNTPASIDLSTCKIWLEITDTDGMIYAVGAAAIPDAPHIEHVDSNNDNICDSCGKYMDNIGARLAGHSLTLDGSVGVNFYMELSSEVISDGSAYMEFTLPGGKTSTVKVNEAPTEEISGKTYHKFRCQVNAAEMTDTITAQLRSTVGNSKVYEYTVKEYADYLFAHKEDNAEFAKAANLIEAMVNYGSYAQIYAGYNAENLAVGDAGNLKSVDDVTIGEYTYTPNANETKVQFAGANLSLLSTTTLRMYFKITDVDVANVTFTYGENTLEKTQSGDYYYVELVGIPASKLDDDCVVTVNDGTNSFDVTYTPMAYCANVVNRETTETRTESLKNLIKALVLYNRAADAYIPED